MHRTFRPAVLHDPFFIFSVHAFTYTYSRNQTYCVNNHRCRINKDRSRDQKYVRLVRKGTSSSRPTEILWNRSHSVLATRDTLFRIVLLRTVVWVLDLRTYERAGNRNRRKDVLPKQLFTRIHAALRVRIVFPFTGLRIFSSATSRAPPTRCINCVRVDSRVSVYRRELIAWFSRGMHLISLLVGHENNKICFFRMLSATSNDSRFWIALKQLKYKPRWRRSPELIL